MPTYLIVANQTLGGAELIDHVRSVMSAGPCEFYLVVPATPPNGHLTWTEGGARSIATQRLDEGLERLRALGANVSGEVGDWSPMLAVEDVLRHRGVDGVIVATLPFGVSRWLKLSLPERIERRCGLPVAHVVVAPETSAAAR